MKKNRWMLLAMLGLLLGCARPEDTTFEASAIIEGTAIKVAAQTGGYLIEVAVDEGEQVEPAQPIAVVDTEKLSFQLEGVQAGLEELVAQREIAEANVQRVAEDFEYARTKYERYQTLYQTNAAPEQVVDDLRVAYTRAQITLESAKKTLASIASKEKALRAQAKLLQRQIADGVITAPISGTITTRYYDTGETVPTFAPVVEMIDLSRMWAKVYVSETYLPRIRIGDRATVRIDGTEQTLQGVVAWISPKAEFTPKNILTEESRTALVYAVKVTVDNPEHILKHGMPVVISLPLRS